MTNKCKKITKNLQLNLYIKEAVARYHVSGTGSFTTREPGTFLMWEVAIKLQRRVVMVIGSWRLSNKSLANVIPRLEDSGRRNPTPKDRPGRERFFIMKDPKEIAEYSDN